MKPMAPNLPQDFGVSNVEKHFPSGLPFSRVPILRCDDSWLPQSGFPLCRGFRLHDSKMQGLIVNGIPDIPIPDIPIDDLPLRVFTHDFGHHDDVLMMVYSGSSLELSPEKSYLHLFPEITFLRNVRRLLVYLPARMHDSRRLP
jgi:hypothetical protein